MTPSLLKLVKETPLFSHLDKSELSARLGHLSLHTLAKDQTLFHQNDESDALYIVQSGCIKSSIGYTTDHLSQDHTSSYVYKGGVIGEIDLISDSKRTTSATAVKTSKLLKIPKQVFEEMLETSPTTLQQTAEVISQKLREHQLFTIYSELFDEIDSRDFANIIKHAQWVHLKPSDILINQGEIGDCFYIVVSGHLHAEMRREDNSIDIIGHVFRGETIGEMSLVNPGPRSATVIALRDCELVRFSKQTFDKLISQHNQLMLSITRIVSRRLQQNLAGSLANNTIANIAVIPLSENVDLDSVCQRLHQNLNQYDSCQHISSQSINHLIDIPNAAQIEMDSPQNIRFVTWLDKQEARYRFVIYQTDKEPSHWTKRCVKRADKVFLVANYGENPELSPIETFYFHNTPETASIEQSLLLLHPNGDTRPNNTRQWLSPRAVNTHYHLRWTHEDDFDRIARFISGNAIGLVFSGGGARGFSHIGVYRALKEAGITVDMVVGTSIGALIGAQCAAEWEADTILQATRNSLAQKTFSGLTLPLISLIKGKHINQKLIKLFGQMRIEDLWINFVCISSNLSNGNTHLHTQGRLSKAIRASGALPGISEPVLEKGELLVDGCLVNFLPFDVMQKYCQRIIVSDASSKNGLRVQNTEDYMPSPWRILLHKLSPFHKPMGTPNILEILASSTIMKNSKRTQQIRNSADIYFHPPLGSIGPLDFSAVDQLVDKGYHHARSQLAEISTKHWRRDASQFAMLDKKVIK